jgi:hypothetical protein
VREIIFFQRAKLIMGSSLRSGQFKGQKGLGSLEKSQELSHYEFCPRKENNISHFPNQQYIGNFMSQRDRERVREREREREKERERARARARTRVRARARARTRTRTRARERGGERERERKRGREQEQERERE